jgi:hypothetical protein
MSDMEPESHGTAWFPTLARIGRWRVWRLLAYMLLTVLLLGAIGNAVGNAYYGWRVKGELQALKAAGKPVTPADVTPPPVPDAGNAAPLYGAAALIVKQHQAGAGPTPSAGVPSPSPGVTRAFGYRDDAWNDPKVLACLAQLVKDDQDALDLVRQASAKPGYRSDADYSDPVKAVFPQFEEARSLANLLASAAVVASHEGDQAQALECLRMGYLLGRRLSEEPFLIAELVVCATDTVLTRALAHVLTRGPLPEREARRIAGELASLDYLTFAGRAWDGERACAIDLFARARHNQLRGIMTSEPPGTGDRWLWWAYAYPLRPILYADELTYLRLMALQRAQLATPPFRRGQLPPVRERELSPLPAWRHPITRALTPIGLPVAAKTDAVQTWRNLARTVIGLQLYRQTHRAYPRDLGELRRSGWDVPKDIFTDGDFIYRPAGSTFILYSVGFDRKDDGGRPIPRLSLDPERARRARPTTNGEKGDIVWGE